MYHAALRHRSRMQLALDEVYPDTPYLCVPTGCPCTKATMVSITETAVTKMGVPVINWRNQPLFGGHGLRTGGAYWLVSAGVELAKIELLGRWKSHMAADYDKAAKPDRENWADRPSLFCPSLPCPF
eukprot:6472802-Amphidinium_carterae.1